MKTILEYRRDVHIQKIINTEVLVKYFDTYYRLFYKQFEWNYIRSGGQFKFITCVFYSIWVICIIFKYRVISINYM